MCATVTNNLLRLTKPAFVIMLLAVRPPACAAQIGSITVNVIQPLAFGAFFQGSTGGTVAISYSGARTITGSVTSANFGITYNAALFQITAPVATVVEIMNGPDVNLTGSNGGTMKMHIGTASTGSLFVTTAIPPAYTSVYIGGTLTVGTATANPSGSYSGTFQVTFVHEY